LYQLDTSFQKVAFILDHIPDAESNSLLLVISYWQLFDGIEFPESLLQEILKKATPPETISRSRRKVLEQLRYQQYLKLHRMAKEEGKVEAPNKEGGALQ